jgi:hypothetical protein
MSMLTCKNKMMTLYENWQQFYMTKKIYFNSGSQSFVFNEHRFKLTRNLIISIPFQVFGTKAVENFKVNSQLE